MVQQARDAMDRTGDLIREALACVKTRSPEQVDELAEELRKHLIGRTEEPRGHRLGIRCKGLWTAGRGS